MHRPPGSMRPHKFLRNRVRLKGKSPGHAQYPTTRARAAFRAQCPRLRRGCGDDSCRVFPMQRNPSAHPILKSPEGVRDMHLRPNLIAPQIAFDSAAARSSVGALPGTCDGCVAVYQRCVKRWSEVRSHVDDERTESVMSEVLGEGLSIIPAAPKARLPLG